MRAVIHGKPGRLQAGIQGIYQFDMLRRRPGRTQPADAVVAPVAGLFHDEFEVAWLDTIRTAKQQLQLFDWRAAQKSQREMERVGAHATAAPVLVQPFSGEIEGAASGLIRPQGEEQPQAA